MLPPYVLGYMSTSPDNDSSQNVDVNIPIVSIESTDPSRDTDLISSPSSNSLSRLDVSADSIEEDNSFDSRNEISSPDPIDPASSKNSSRRSSTKRSSKKDRSSGSDHATTSSLSVSDGETSRPESPVRSEATKSKTHSTKLHHPKTTQATPPTSEKSSPTSVGQGSNTTTSSQTQPKETTAAQRKKFTPPQALQLPKRTKNLNHFIGKKIFIFFYKKFCTKNLLCFFPFLAPL